ncbi:MAG: tetratricopeptide repeat protein [Candidatus Cryosericum sp.]
MAASEQERLRVQIEEFVGRRDYDAALRFAVREADLAYGKQRYAQGVEVLKSLLTSLLNHQINQWNIYVAAYQKIVGLDNQLKDKASTIRDLVELSRYCIKLGDFDKALSAANSAVSIDARSTEALNQKARVLAYRRDYIHAFSALDASLEVSPHDPRTLYLKGTILGNNGKFSDALAVYEEVRRTDPSYPGLGKAIAEMRRQIDWKVQAVEGPGTGQRPSQPSQVDSVPAIQRKTRSTEPEEVTRSALETLYDEAVVGGGEANAPAESKGAGAVEAGVAAEARAFQEYVPEHPDTQPEVPQAQNVAPAVLAEENTEMTAVPHQAWSKDGEETSAPVRQSIASESNGLTVLSPEELRKASLKHDEGAVTGQATARVSERQPVSATSAGTDLESRLVRVMKDMRRGAVGQDDLMQRLSEAGEVSIPLTLGVLYFNFLRNPADGHAMNDLLGWLQRNGYHMLPQFVLEEALAQGVRLDFHDSQVAGIVLAGDASDMSSDLRMHRAELLLEHGDTSAYVREELSMVRQAGTSVSAEGIVRQLSQVLEHCKADDASVREVLAAAADLDVLDQLVDRVTTDPAMTRLPALEAALVEHLGHAGVDESTFLSNEDLFQRVTLSAEKSAILRRILTNAVSPAVRRKVLQSLLVLGTPNMAEYTELVGLMVQEHDSSGAAYLIQYLVDHRQEVTDGRFLLERLSHLVPMDYESRYGLGLAAEQLGIHSAAATCFIAAIRARPGDPDTVQRALEAILGSGEVDLIADVSAFCQLAPSDVEGMVDKATAETPALTTGSVEQRLVSAWGAYAGARYEEAVAISSATVRGGGDPRFYIPMALSFVHLGLPELASRELDRAIRQPGMPDDVKLVLKYQAAVIQLGQGNSGQAAQLLQEVSESSPDFRDVNEVLSKCGSQGSKIVKL